MRNNGVLGKSTTIRGDRTRDVYSIFVAEAQRASLIRRLFEAATKRPKPDTTTIMALLPDEHQEHAEYRGRAKQVALQYVADTVEKRVAEDCFHRVLPRDKDRQGNYSALLRQWGFHSLLGAMWLQFMWLATDEGTRYCEYCGRILDPDRRSDARTCGEPEGRGKACAQGARRMRNRAQGKV